MENKQIANMEKLYHLLGEMNLSKANRAAIAGMIRTAFVNGFHTAHEDITKITDPDAQIAAATQNETFRHIMWLAHENSK